MAVKSIRVKMTLKTAVDLYKPGVYTGDEITDDLLEELEAGSEVVEEIKTTNKKLKTESSSPKESATNAKKASSEEAPKKVLLKRK